MSPPPLERLGGYPSPGCFFPMPSFFSPATHFPLFLWEGIVSSSLLRTQVKAISGASSNEIFFSLRAHCYLNPLLLYIFRCYGDPFILYALCGGGRNVLREIQFWLDSPPESCFIVPLPRFPPGRRGTLPSTDTDPRIVS